MRFDSLLHHIAPVIILITSLLLPGKPYDHLKEYSYKPSTSSNVTNFEIDLSKKQRGMTWVGKGKINIEHLDPLLSVNAEWIMLIPFSYQKNYNSTEVKMANTNSYYWGESDLGIIQTAEMARQKGMKTLLKPHVWLMNMNDGYWRGMIEMDNQEDWDIWFDSYQKFILYYAKMAAQYDFDAFCIGTELHQSAKQQENKWRALIREVRAVYSGDLVYAANWSDEFEDVKFWDALDFIGIQAYFPLTSRENPSVGELMNGWQPHLKKISAVQKTYGRPVLFTEIGYKSTSDGAIRPWEWPSFKDNLTRKVSLETQANGYEAFFRVFWHQPWFAGAYFWDWYPNHTDSGGSSNKAFTPQNKPAEQILRKWFAKK